MSWQEHQGTHRQLPRRPIVPCHRLIGAGVTALVLFTPLPAAVVDAAESLPPTDEQLDGTEPVGAAPSTVATDTDADTDPTDPFTSTEPSRPNTIATPRTVTVETVETSTTSTSTTSTSSTISTTISSTTSATSTTTPPRTRVALGPLTSPDVGASCADGLDAEHLNAFVSDGIAGIGGADYQRAIRLPDDRVLWTFQDAFVNGRLLHNVAVIQSGRCFTRVGPGDRSWLFADDTDHQRRWFWVLDGVVSADETTVELFVVEMRETGPQYLSRTRPSALRRVTVDLSNLEATGAVEEPWLDDRLYGWSVTSDAEHTYLYSHCYQQFGYDTMLGFGECASEVTVARVPKGDPGAERTFWDGTGWNPDPASAVAVVDATVFFAGNNPAQIRFTGERFELVEKRGDWFGETVEFATAPHPAGPFEPVASVAQPLPCSFDTCNSYFATWVPWPSSDGTAIWTISHNRWDGTETADHLEHYRPSFHAVHLPR